jgi:hypothetical protein
VSSDQWKRAFAVVEGDVRDFSAKEFKGVSAHDMNSEILILHA